MADGKFIAYYRVSTDQQGRSGLGLDAQRAAVEGYLNGGRWKLVGEHVEVESGKLSTRPELAKALAACRRTGSTLIIAKLDRLGRNVAFVSGLMEAGVEFVAVDMPAANRLTLHIMAAMAEHEGKAISERTKVALAAAKARGVVMGGCKLKADQIPVVMKKASKAGLQVRQARARARARDLAPVIEELRSIGIVSQNGIAKALNARGVQSARGGTWTNVTVAMMLALID